MPESPPGLRERVHRFFGPSGLDWLGRLPALYEASVAKWQLQGCRVSRVHSASLVCFAVSPVYGPVVLKIAYPNHELLTEIAAMHLLAGPAMRRCHAFDVDLGAMLLEMVEPGNDLRSIDTSEERTTVAARLAAAVPQPWSAASEDAVRVGGRTVRLPRLSDWAGRAFARCRADGIAPSRMLRLVDSAEALLGEIERPGDPLHVLHGDLNHWNMLQDSRGAWRAIDPKGVVTVRAMEAGRFVINELDFLPASSWPSWLVSSARVLGAAFGEPPHRIAMCAFFDKVLSTSWSYEEYVRRDLSSDLIQAETLLTAYRAMAPLAEDRQLRPT